MALSLTTIAVIGDELALAWSDGSETYLHLELLRRACPCATCQGEPDGFRPAEKPQIEYRPDSFRLVSHTLVGNYGFQPIWGDGHQTGIFSFDYLRKLEAFALQSSGGGGCGCGSNHHDHHHG